VRPLRLAVPGGYGGARRRRRRPARRRLHPRRRLRPRLRESRPTPRPPAHVLLASLLAGSGTDLTLSLSLSAQDDPVCVAARAQGHKVVSELWVDDSLDRAVLADADRVRSQFPLLTASLLPQSFSCTILPQSFSDVAALGVQYVSMAAVCHSFSFLNRHFLSTGYLLVNERFEGNTGQ
jgi:hypothetical protein